MTNKD